MKKDDEKDLSCFKGKLHSLSTADWRHLLFYKENYIYEELYKFAKSKNETFVKYLDGKYKNNEQSARELASSINDDLFVDFSNKREIYVRVEPVEQYLHNLGRYKLVFHKTKEG